MSRCRDENHQQVTTPLSPLFNSASNKMEKAAEQIASDKAELLPSSEAARLHRAQPQEINIGGGAGTWADQHCVLASTSLVSIGLPERNLTAA